jgi:hypothetical protein
MTAGATVGAAVLGRVGSGALDVPDESSSSFDTPPFLLLLFILRVRRWRGGTGGVCLVLDLFRFIPVLPCDGLRGFTF